MEQNELESNGKEETSKQRKKAGRKPVTEELEDLKHNFNDIKMSLDYIKTAFKSFSRAELEDIKQGKSNKTPKDVYDPQIDVLKKMLETSLEQNAILVNKMLSMAENQSQKNVVYEEREPVQNNVTDMSVTQLMTLMDSEPVKLLLESKKSDGAMWEKIADRVLDLLEKKQQPAKISSMGQIIDMPQDGKTT